MWLKRRTWLNILGGGFAGNATFLGGYALAKGTVDLPAALISLPFISGSRRIYGLWLIGIDKTTVRPASRCCPSS